MPVHVTRKRNGIWYARGSVKVGGQTTVIPEYSTGCASRADADAVAAKRDREEREAILGGPDHRLKQVTIADCLAEYVGRAGGVKPWDLERVNEFNEMIGNHLVSNADDAWKKWLEKRGNQQPSSIARWRATLQAALHYGCERLKVPPPKLPSVKGGSGDPKIAYLMDEDRPRLIAAYNPHAMCPILVLAYQGMRTQEALQIQWGQVNFTRREIFIPKGETKTKKARTVPMHPKVDAMLFGLWSAAGKPRTGHVFISAKGNPYTDTRGVDEKKQGGNPLSRAHQTACRIAGITDFRVHDWRHDWATRMVQNGVHLRTLMKLGGWAKLHMVAVYATVTADLEVEAVRRLA